MKLTIKELVFPLEGRPTPACHASTLAVLPDGEVLAAWFGGALEGADDVEIWISRRSPSSGWSYPERISQPDELPCWNPVLFPRGNEVTLWYKHGRPISTWYTLTMRSQDGGRTWTPARELVPGDRGGRGPVKNKPLLLTDGRIIAGASHEFSDGRWLSFADISDDGGMTWTRSDYIPAGPNVKLIQPTLWESASGVHMLMRSANGQIYRSDSVDGGLHWGAASPISMPNNNSGLDCVPLPDDRLALVCNPVGIKGVRTPVSLFVSSNNGGSWEKVMDLQDGEGEYSYPAVVYANNALHITFTWRRQSIMYCRVNNVAN